MIVLSLVRGPAGAATLATAITVARGVVVFPVVTKLLPVAEYGLWSQLGVAATLGSFVALAGTDSASLRFLSGTRDVRKDAAFTGVALSAIALAMVSAAACVLLALGTPIVEHGARAPVAALGALIVGLVAERLAVTQLRRLLALWSYTVAAAAFAVADIVAIGGALALELGLAGAIVAWGSVKTAIAFVVVVYSSLRFGAVARPAWRRMRDLFEFGLPLLGIALLNWMLNLSDRYLVGWFLGLEPVALYSASYALGGLIALPFAPVFLIVQPRASGLWEDGRREEAARYLCSALEWSVWLALPSLAVLILWSAELLSLVARPEYAAAATSAVILAAAIFIQMLSGFAETEIGLARHTSALVRPFAVAALVNVAANVVLIHRVGYVGAAVATLLAMSVLAVWTLTFARIGPGWAVRPDRVLAAVVTASVALAVVAAVRPYGATVVTLVALLMVSAYAVVGRLVMRRA